MTSCGFMVLSHDWLSYRSFSYMGSTSGSHTHEKSNVTSSKLVAGTLVDSVSFTSLI